MANPVWPSSLCPVNVEWRLQKAGVQFRSPFTGSLQAVDFLGEYWMVSMRIPGEGRLLTNSGLLESLLMYLAGGVNQIDIYNWVRPIPRGTMRGSPTVQTTTVRGDSSIVLSVSAGATLLPGDMFGVGDQLFMTRTACSAVSTTLTVPVVNRVRGVIAGGTAVTWNKPLVSMVAPELSAGLVYGPGMRAPTELQLVEP